MCVFKVLSRPTFREKALLNSFKYSLCDINMLPLKTRLPYANMGFEVGSESKERHHFSFGLLSITIYVVVHPSVLEVI
jgi:hypothetical protein